MTALKSLVRRTAYLGYLGGTVFSVALLFIGACQGSPPALACGIVFAAVAFALRTWLRADPGELRDEISADAEGVFDEKHSTPGRDMAELASLLREMEKLERRRTDRNFDPWALLSTRNEIRSLINNRPEMRDLFGLR
jgi:hypothetical protein